MRVHYQKYNKTWSYLESTTISSVLEVPGENTHLPLEGLLEKALISLADLGKEMLT